MWNKRNNIIPKYNAQDIKEKQYNSSMHLVYVITERPKVKWDYVAVYGRNWEGERKEEPIIKRGRYS